MVCDIAKSIDKADTDTAAGNIVATCCAFPLNVEITDIIWITDNIILYLIDNR